jgi:peptide/nickel transport system substrate-binding protein
VSPEGALMRILAFALVLTALPGCKKGTPARSDGSPAAATGPVTVIACGAGGCPVEPAAAAKEGGSIVVHVEAEPAILCDLVEHDAWSRWIIENQVAETLFFQDPWTGAIQPRLSESFEADGDKSLTLHLRAGVKWHDGKPFSAADVVYTLEKARDPKVGADQRADLEPIGEVSSPDDRTVVLKLVRPAPYLRQALSHIAILPKHAYEGKDLRRAEASRSPIGTGPFRFDHWKQGEEIVITRHSEYWGRKARLDKITFRMVRDKQVAYELYKRGEIDVMWRLASPRVGDEARNELKLAGHTMFVWTPRAYFFIVWNTKKFPDARVRRALTMLVDRERFREIAFAGHARPVTGPYPPGTPSYDAKLQPWPFDPKAARALLDSAGVKTLKLTFLLTAGSRTVEQLATLMKEDFAKAGVELEVATVDFAVLLDRLRRHAFDASSLQWTMSLEQDNYSMFHSSQAEAGQNYGAWKHPGADALLEKIRTTPNDDARHALDREFHGLVHTEQPYTFLSSPEVQTLVSRRIHGLLPSTDGFTFSTAWVDAP